MQKEPFNIEITNLAEYLHQAVLNPHLKKEALNEIVDASIYFNFAALCTNLIRIPLARERLGTNKKTKLIALIGFPFGDIPHEFKQEQAEWAAEQGADELDVVPNFLELHEGRADILADELSRICDIGLPTRAIIDPTNLNEANLSLIIDASIDAGVQGIQAGNGFGPTITSKTVEALLKLIRGRCSLKAVGGIKNLFETLDLIKSGCSEIGTSRGTELIKEFRKINQ